MALSLESSVYMERYKSFEFAQMKTNIMTCCDEPLKAFKRNLKERSNSYIAFSYLTVKKSRSWRYSFHKDLRKVEIGGLTKLKCIYEHSS